MKIPLNIEDFKEMIDQNYCYVDKTVFIQKVLYDYVTVYTRPKGFGKTLNLSMLYYFFSNKEKDNAYLFDGLEINKSLKSMEHQNQYPVIYISFKKMNKKTMEEQKIVYSQIIQEVLNNFEELNDENIISEYYQRDLNKIREGTTNDFDIYFGLERIMQCLKLYYKKSVVVLIDDYDIPLQCAYINGYYDQMDSFLSQIFTSVFKSNNTLEIGVLAGCLSVPKAGMFSGFNNYVLRSLLDDGYNSYFGFIQLEAEDLLKEYHLEKYSTEVKEWYGGYQFGKNEVYNPYSIFNFISQNILHTGDNQTLVMPVKEDYIFEKCIKKYNHLWEFKDLMRGEILTKNIDETITYKDVDYYDFMDSFLLLNGYLTVNEQITYQKIKVAIPNKEIREILNQTFMKQFEQYVASKKQEFMKCIFNEEIDQADCLLYGIYNNFISYKEANLDFFIQLLSTLANQFNIEMVKSLDQKYFNMIIYPKCLNEKALAIQCKYYEKDCGIQDELIKEINDCNQMLQSKGYAGVINYEIIIYPDACSLSKVK